MKTNTRKMYYSTVPIRNLSLFSAKLLKGFFDYYQQFDFRGNEIDVHSGTVIQRGHMFQALMKDPHKDKHNVFTNTALADIKRFKRFCEASYVALCAEDNQACDTGMEHWGLQKVLPVKFSAFDLLNVYIDKEDEPETKAPEDNVYVF